MKFRSSRSIGDESTLKTGVSGQSLPLDCLTTMTCRSAGLSAPSITVRPSPDEKERFATLAAARGLSESALALTAIRTVDCDGFRLAGSLRNERPDARDGPDHHPAPSRGR
jgi:hypothetical protein